MGDHLWQSGPSMAAIVGPGGPSMATKFAIDGPGGPVVAGDLLRRDSSRAYSFIVLFDAPCTLCTPTGELQTSPVQKLHSRQQKSKQLISQSQPLTYQLSRQLVVEL